MKPSEQYSHYITAAFLVAVGMPERWFAVQQLQQQAVSDLRDPREGSKDLAACREYRSTAYI